MKMETYLKILENSDELYNIIIYIRLFDLAKSLFFLLVDFGGSPNGPMIYNPKYFPNQMPGSEGLTTLCSVRFRRKKTKTNR